MDAMADLLAELDGTDAPTPEEIAAANGRQTRFLQEKARKESADDEGGLANIVLPPGVPPPTDPSPTAAPAVGGAGAAGMYGPGAAGMYGPAGAGMYGPGAAGMYGPRAGASPMAMPALMIIATRA